MRLTGTRLTVKLDKIQITVLGTGPEAVQGHDLQKRGNSSATPYLDSLPGSHFPTWLRRPEPRVGTWKVAGICRAKPQRRRNYRMGVWMVSPESWTDHWAVLLVREGKTTSGLPGSWGLRTEKWRDVRGLAKLEGTGGPSSTQCRNLNAWRHLRHSADEGPHPWGRPSLSPTQQSLKSISSESHTKMGFGGWILPSQRDLGNPLGFPQTLSSTTQNQTSASSFRSASTCTAHYRTSINSSKRGNRTEGPYISCTMSGLQSNLPDTQGSKVT